MHSATTRYESLCKELDPKKLMARAEVESGLSDYGDRGFIEPLGKLLDCAAREANFHDAGLDSYKADVVRCLVNRLRMHADIQRHPEILDEDVSDPIVVIGLPRSGTTKAQRMLSAAPDVQKLYLWRILNPAPFPNAKKGEPDPRINAASQGYNSDDTPELRAAHLLTASQPEEDWALFDATFDDWVWSVLFAPLPSYTEWVTKRPAGPNYQYVRRVLQYLQWQDGGKRGRPWILKGIGHIAQLDALLECYPKAVLVHIHRSPRQAIASMAKLASMLWSFKVKPLDPEWVGATQLQWYATAMDRYLEARDRLGLNDSIVDVKYQQMRDDPMTAMHAIYERAGRPISAEAARAMQQWDIENEQHQHGKHEYSQNAFGLSDEKIDRAFSEYTRRFITS